MLDTLRKMTSGWVVQILMLLLVVSFGVWGVADVFRGYGANDIAKVGSISLTGAEFRRRASLQGTARHVANGAMRRTTAGAGKPVRPRRR